MKNILQRQKNIVVSTSWARKTPWQRFCARFKKDWELHLMILLPLIYLILFEYYPLYGIQIAFKDYSARKGILGSAWVGLDNFKRFFENHQWSTYVKNTLRISLYSIIFAFPIPIILALTLHVNENKFLKKLTQNVSYVPHFISMVVLVGIMNQLLNPITGLWGSLIKLFDWNITGDIRMDADSFIHLYTWSGVWQQMGWSAIVYISALSAVPQDLHEAAMLDGASRFKRVLYVDLPTIMPTVIMMFILRFGSVMSVGYDKVYLMQNSLNLEVSETISTYVYKQGIGKNDMSYGTAVSLMNTVINLFLMFLVNWIVKKLGDEDTQGLF